MKDLNRFCYLCSQANPKSTSLVLSLLCINELGAVTAVHQRAWCCHCCASTSLVLSLLCINELGAVTAVHQRAWCCHCCACLCITSIAAPWFEKQLICYQNSAIFRSVFSGVLLLNSVLTVREHAANSHQSKVTVCVRVRVCVCVCVCVCVTMKKKRCQTNGKHDKRHRRYFK